MRIDPTPNPNSVKVTLDVKITDQGRSFSSAAEAESENVALAAALLNIRGIQNVFMLNNFVTVTQDGSKNWDTLSTEIAAVVRSHVV